MYPFAKNLARQVANYLPAKLICRFEYYNQNFVGFNERPIEFGFVFSQLTRIYPRTILDVGTGTTALPHLMRNCGFLVTAIDNIRDYWPAGMSNRHYYVINDDITNSKLEDKYDVLTCISVLEHIEKSDEAVRNMFQLLSPNGYLILTFPFTSLHYVRNVYDLPNSRANGQSIPFICQSYSSADVDRWLMANGGKIVAQEFWQFWDGDYWSEGNKITPPHKVAQTENHQLTCLLIQKQPAS